MKNNFDEIAMTLGLFLMILGNLICISMVCLSFAK